MRPIDDAVIIGSGPLSVAVISGRAVDAALERAMSATRIVAAAGSQIGFTTTPKNGGCTAMIRRVLSPVMTSTPNADPVPFLQTILQAIAMRKVAASAEEARLLGFLTAADRIVMNGDHLLRVAEEEAAALAETDIAPRVCYAAGRDARAALKTGIHQLRRGAFISEEDAEVSGRIAHVLCGGDITTPQWVDEEYFLQLEQSVIPSVARDPEGREAR
jgi:3-hydroxyacyl-CoA dehydrogenase